MTVGDEVEIITPTEQVTAKVLEIRDDKDFTLDVGNTNAEVYIKFSSVPKNCDFALCRTLGIKE